MISLRSSRSSMRTSPSLRRLSIGVLSLFALASACTKKPDARTKPAVPVSATRARLADVPYTVDANGVVVPLQSVAVASQVEGIVKRVAFSEGQNVSKGQVLFEVDSRPYQASYRQALAALARDKANAENAQSESKRYASLAQQDYVTKEQADQQRANAAATAATVGADEAQVSAAKFNLDNATIRAPISGRTGALLVKEGNLVHASGATPLVVINQVSPILVRFAIPATQLPLLQKYGSAGGLAVVATPNSGSSQAVDSGPSPVGLNIGRADPGTGATSDPQSAGGPPNGVPRSGRSTGANASVSSQLATLVSPENGTLTFIDNAVDTTTGTVLLKATFPNSNQRLWAGEFVSTQLRLFVEQKALVVPTQAVVTGQTGSYVYIVTDSGTAQQRPVTVERTAGNQTIIASGLRAGEQVVTEGQSRLTPNAKVTLMTPQGAPVGGKRGGGPGGRRGAGGAAGAAPAAGDSAKSAPAAGGARRGGKRAGGAAPPAATPE
ncbi:MAG: efflux RND transporter periplasmic adaptor subunit [bacterium]